MNEDDQDTGQQGYGSDQDPTQQQPQAGQDGGATGNAGAASAGQASYGNSGEADLLSQGQQGPGQSQNSSSFGQDTDLGEPAGSSPTGDDRQSSGFIGSGASGNVSERSADANSAGSTDEGMPLGTAGGGYGGSSETSDRSDEQVLNKTDDAGGQEQSDSGFAEQGQGALTEDTARSDETSGITDIETERSQGRETEVEGSAL